MTKTKSLTFAALTISLAGFLITSWIGSHIFEGIPHVEDEITYNWQAILISRGDLYIESPVCPKCFLVPFVIDYNGIRFGKYPLGWPAALSLAIRINARQWLPPFLTAVNLWFVFRLVSKLINEKTAFFTSALTLTSPFFLMNSASLLAHNWGLFLTLAFVLSWLDAINTQNLIPAWVLCLVSGMSMGILFLTRPLTAVAVGLPFLIHGIWLILRRPDLRAKIIAIGIIALSLASLHFLWQFILTGDPLLNPYELWWPYDKIGFGSDVGLQPGGFSPEYAYANTDFSLWVGAHDFLGWPYLSYIFIPFGFYAFRKYLKGITTILVLPSLILFYSLYWIGAWLFGPRYYFEGIFIASLLTVMGIVFLAGRIEKHNGFNNRITKLRWGMVLFIVGCLIAGNILFYLPLRIGGLKGLYGHSRDKLTPFLTTDGQNLTPALIIVRPEKDWVEYGTFLELSSPYFDSPYIFTHSRDEELDRMVIREFPDRNPYYYDLEKPLTFTPISIR